MPSIKSNAGRFSIVPTAAALARELSRSELRILILIARWYDHRTGESHPSQGLLAAYLGVSRQFVSKIIERLVTRGYLTKRRVRHGSAYSHNEYVILFPPIPSSREAYATARRLRDLSTAPVDAERTHQSATQPQPVAQVATSAGCTTGQRLTPELDVEVVNSGDDRPVAGSVVDADQQSER